MPDINQVIKSKFLRFVIAEPLGMKKLPIIYVDNKDGERLGKIYYYPPWKKYVFAPKRDTVYDKKCNDDIGKAMDYAERLRSHGS